jgi:hypothetical protein
MTRFKNGPETWLFWAKARADTPRTSPNALGDLQEQEKALREQMLVPYRVVHH